MLSKKTPPNEPSLMIKYTDDEFECLYPTDPKAFDRLHAQLNVRDNFLRLSENFYINLDKIRSIKFLE